MEYMPNFQLHRPESAEEAVKLRSEHPGALFVAGGTDMIVNVRRGIEQLMNLKLLAKMTPASISVRA